jgi:hypothetical protein
MKNVVPFPGVLSKVISPPCAWIALRAPAKPRPVPFALVVNVIGRLAACGLEMYVSRKVLILIILSSY